MLNPNEINTLRSSMGGAPGGGSTPSNGQALDDASFKQWSQPKPVATVGQKPSLLGGVKNDIVNQVKGNYQEAKTSYSNAIAGKENPFAAGANIAKNASEAVLAPVNQTVGKVINKVASPVINELGDKIGNTPPAQAVAKWADEHPQLAGAIGDTTQAGLNTITAATMLEGAPKASENLQKGATAVKDSLPGSPLEGGKNLIQNAKEHLSEKNVEPQVETSAKRVTKPLDTYDTYAKQAKQAVTDVKADPPLAKVGEDIGTNFDKVVKMRQDVGKTMSSELKSFANKPISVEKGIGDFQQQLIDNGATYDAVSKEIIGSDTSKFSNIDKGILEQYANELQGLGRTPSAAKVDAFISRIPKEIEGLKAEKGINFATNAERIIKSNLSSLRDSLGEAGTPEYNTARKQYSSLSNFMEEGSQYLGKKTQSGDFAKDASMTKSAVTSLLNNGKKDWLVKLEDLTGYKGLDNSVMALQAMKDAGDARGTSLLQHLSESTPHTSSGFAAKIFDYAVGKAKKTFLGSPEEQTRTFLKSLEKDSEPSILNDNGGPAQIGMTAGDVTKRLTPKDTDLMTKFIDDVRLKGSNRPEFSNTEEGVLSKMNEILGIDQDLSKTEIADKYEKILKGLKPKKKYYPWQGDTDKNSKPYTFKPNN